jgi:hypothetical protein
MRLCVERADKGAGAAGAFGTGGHNKLVRD